MNHNLLVLYAVIGMGVVGSIVAYDAGYNSLNGWRAVRYIIAGLLIGALAGIPIIILGTILEIYHRYVPPVNPYNPRNW
jgi:hypothetical protein